MNLKHNNNNNMDELDEPLRRAVLDIRSETLSKKASERLLENARSLSETKGHSPPYRKPEAARRPKTLLTRRVIAFATSAALLLVWTIWPQQTIAWEEVVTAVAKQPWMAVVKQNEKTWYRSDPKLIASVAMVPQLGEICVFIDLEKGTLDHFAEKAPFGFAREPGKVFRKAIRDDNRRGIDAAVRRYEAALLGRTSEMLLDSYEVASKDVTEITKDSKRLLEFRFTLDPIKEHHPHQIVIIVDPNSKLPLEKRVTYPSGNEIVSTISFPNSGPSSIFELSVPRDTEIVDTRPKEDSQNVLDALRRGRTEMDPYFAVRTEGKDRVPRPQRVSEQLIWRRGTRWRIERARIFDPKNPNPAPDSSDPVGWWHTFVDNADTSIEVISDGQTECTYKRDRSTGNKPDPNNPSFLLIERYVEKMRPHRDPSDPDTNHYEILAEWIGYPKLIYDGQFEIEREPADGPRDTVCFTMTYQDSVERLWLDPKRDHLAIRHEWINKEDGRNIGTQEVLETVQTPTGKWLPSVVRTFVPVRDGKEQSRYTNFFYRFDAEIDDSKFVVSDL